MGPARQLLDRYLDEIASPADLTELVQLLGQRPDVADALAAAVRLETLLESHFQECRTRTAANVALAQVPATTPSVRFRLPLKWCAAAVLLVATGILFGFWLGRSQSRPGAVVSGRVLVNGVEVVQVPDGLLLEVAGTDSAIIRLPDGSHAELAPTTTAVLRQQGRRKMVELDRGRATFHVQKGGKRFRVDTPIGSISTLNADFSVELEPRDDEDEGVDTLDKRGTLLLVVAALVGQVEVYSGGQSYVLAAGQKQSFADKTPAKSQKPSLWGVVVKVSDGSMTVETPPAKKGGEATRKDVKLTDQTELIYPGLPKESQKPTVGYVVSVWLKEGSEDTAARVQFKVKQIILDGVVSAVAEDGASFTLQRAKGERKIDTELKIPAGSKVVYKDAEKGDKPTVGYFVRAWLKPGTTDTISGVVFSSKKIEAPPTKGKKPAPDKKPGLSGTVKAIAKDGKSFTLTIPPTKKGGEPSQLEVQIGKDTKVTAGKEEGKLAVGQVVVVTLADGSNDLASVILIGKSKSAPPDKGTKQVILDGQVSAVAADGASFTLHQDGKRKVDTELKIPAGSKAVYKDAEKGDKPTVGYFARVWLKPGTTDTVRAVVFSSKKIEDTPRKGKKPAPDKKPGLSGTVKAIAKDGKSFTLTIPPAKKGGEPSTVELQFGKRTKVTGGKEEGKLAVGQTVTVLLVDGSNDTASVIEIGNPVQPGKVKKPIKDNAEEKPPEKKKPKEPQKPIQDPAPTAALIDSAVDRHLREIKVPASPLADEAEFLRRITLDLTGRIPTRARTLAFLESKDSNKRRKLIDELLDDDAYGQHMATIWRNLILSGSEGFVKRPNNTLASWLAEQFNDNRGWNAIVGDMLTVEGPIQNKPESAFLMANSENGQPRPSLVAGSTARLFWGVSLRCAECHNHPFATWKQADFWSTAAFFGKLQFSGYKGGPAQLTESSVVLTRAGKKGAPKVVPPRGAAILVPAENGKLAGKFVKARFLGGEEPTLDENAPFRPRFSAWATGKDHPLFARAAVNRMWAHFFGRGFVNPLDSLDTNTPSHPVLLDRLAREFADSGFDLKHLARCIVTSKTYQRSSQAVSGNEADTTAFSHMALKVLTPEMFYDSLNVVMLIDKNDPKMMAGRKGKKGGYGKVSREVFAQQFRPDNDTESTAYPQGIPWFLRLMNSPLLNVGAPIVDRLVHTEASQAEAIDTLYVTVLSRHPTQEETRLLSGYVSRRKDTREGYQGVLWILLNSSEFALNH